jgi:hypothetical protein
MANRLTQDPNLAEAPDFLSEEFEVICQPLAMAQGISEEQAALNMLHAWTRSNDARKQQWAVQQEEVAQEQAEQQWMEEEEHDRIQCQLGEEEERHQNGEQRVEEDHGQSPPQCSLSCSPTLQGDDDDNILDGEPAVSKLNPPATGTMVNMEWSLPPLDYALTCLRKHKYMELWYFTCAGCKDARLANREAGDETFALTSLNSVMTIKPVGSVSASKNAVSNDKLTWDQIQMAQAVLTEHMEKQG